MLATVYTKNLRDRTPTVLGATVGVGLLLVLTMAIYAEIDTSFYYELPAAFLEAVGISPDLGGLAGIAYGAMFGLFGAMTVGGLAISIGAGGIAGEERDNTLGLLLANPRSRRQVLASKLGVLVTLMVAAGLVLWGSAALAPALLDVDAGGASVFALSAHLAANALLWGALGAAIGAWTGKRTVASATAALSMVLSWLVVSFLPLVGDTWADVARAVPWYWFNGHGPEQNGLSGGYLALQLGTAAALASVAFVGVQRRDLRDGERGGGLLDRLRDNALVAMFEERLAGSVRTSRIAVKAITDHQGLLVGASAVLLYVGLLVTPMYNLLPQGFTEIFDDLPDAMIAAIGGVDMSTPTGWIVGEHFSLTVPVAMIAVLAVMGASALAGEEEDRTMDLLLANPLPRWRVVLEKAAAMAVDALLLGVVTFAGVALGVVLGGLDVAILNVAAISALATLLGLAFGGIALLVSAATGRRRVAIGVATGLGALAWFAESFLPLAASFAPWARLSPFHYFLGGDPLTQGMPWGDAAVLTALFLVLVVLAVPLFGRRDIRN